MQKLLIVEDDQSVRTTMVTCLELEGYAVDAVSSTREALGRLEKQSYPIVISDIYLDERTGLDVMRQYHFAGGHVEHARAISREPAVAKREGMTSVLAGPHDATLVAEP